MLILSSWILHWSRPTLRVQPKSHLFRKASLNHTALRGDFHPPLWAPTSCYILLRILLSFSSKHILLDSALWHWDRNSASPVSPLPIVTIPERIRWRENGLAPSCTFSIPVTVARGSRGWFPPPNSYHAQKQLHWTTSEILAVAGQCPLLRNLGPVLQGPSFKSLRKESLPGSTTSLGLTLAPWGTWSVLLRHR